MAKSSGSKLWTLNYRIAMGVIREVTPALASLGIEAKELFLLSELETSPHPAALAETLVMPKATITMYVKHLESLGLVKREIDTADLRRHKLSLTAEGKKVTTRGNALLNDAFDQRLGRMTPAQQADLAALLERLL